MTVSLHTMAPVSYLAGSHVCKRLGLVLLVVVNLLDTAEAMQWAVGAPLAKATTGDYVAEKAKSSLTTTVDVNTPQLTPLQFLVTSSPSLKKIVYAELKNFQSLHGQTFALIDSGLDEPCGLALDRTRGHLYVADRGAKAIYRYRLFVGKTTDRDGNQVLSLTTDGSRLTLVSGHQVEWVTLTPERDLFFSDIATKNILRVPSELIDLVAEGVYQAEDLKVASEKVLEAQAAAKEASEMNPDSEVVLEDEGTQPQLLSVYESASNLYVTTPGGVASDGIRLWWANQVAGTTSGSISQGSVHPKVPVTAGESASVSAFPATALTKEVPTAFGVARTSNLIVFTSNGTSTFTSGSLSTTGGVVYGVPQNGGPAFAFATGLGSPRGLVWDGDNTVFVADEALNAVWSFPAGRLVDNAPLAKAVDFQGAYGVAILQETDEAWTKSAATAAVGRSGAVLLSWLASMAALAIAARL